MRHLYQLTSRQQEVYNLLRENHSMAHVARTLGVAREQVRKLKKEIENKIEAHTFLERVRDDNVKRIFEQPVVETWMPWK